MTHPDWKPYEAYCKAYLNGTLNQQHSITDKELIMQTNLNPIAQLFVPTASDKHYGYADNLKISLILRMDSYKFGHPFAFKSGITGMSSYGTARVGADQTIIPVGMQRLNKKYLSERITAADVEEARQFSVAHFGRELFSYDDWMRVVSVYDGYLPLIIRAVPEGTPIKGGNAIYSVTCLDPLLFWMSAGFETLIQRGIWYPTTIATNDYEIKKDIADYYRLSGADMNLLPFALHDFGARGVSSGETAEIGGMAHLVNFMGSDTVEGIVCANHYYNEPMSAFSVYATEHSVECSFGLDEVGESEYLRHQIETAQRMGLPICSIVIDGKDAMRCAATLCSPEFVELIKSGTTKVVFRPDSGDMMSIVPKIIEMQQNAFGYEMTSTGHKRTKYVGIIQGDGVDSQAIRTLLGNLLIFGYSADCVIFGSGGALLQKVNRDTYKFAQKASAIFVDGEWKGIAKDPITDSGKKSMAGVLTLIRDTYGNLVNVDVSDPAVAARIDADWEDQHQLVYHCGKLYNETTLAEVRARAAK